MTSFATDLLGKRIRATVIDKGGITYINNQPITGCEGIVRLVLADDRGVMLVVEDDQHRLVPAWIGWHVVEVLYGG